jgi:hypothetical protein
LHILKAEDEVKWGAGKCILNWVLHISRSLRFFSGKDPAVSSSIFLILETYFLTGTGKAAGSESCLGLYETLGWSRGCICLISPSRAGKEDPALEMSPFL